MSLPKKADRMKTAMYSTQRLRCIRRLIFAWTHSQSAKSPIQTLRKASLKLTARLKCCAGKGFKTYYATWKLRGGIRLQALRNWMTESPLMQRQALRVSLFQTAISKI